ncbi:MAG TPA: HAMP domain-containing sensor histidine kinase [candidate division Zixibacteria bacterium]|nr:HAMP domain-containing sensor histidine kinase [candidate division Zixibacteria bacterium]
MASRISIVAGALAATVALGAWTVFHQAPSAAPAHLSGIRLSHSIAPSVQIADPSRVVDALGSYALYYFRLLTSNTELWIYGAVAIFGVLMMGLAIGSTRAASPSAAERALELLKQEKERAENLARLKSEFLNQVSHELRTPLAVIMGYIECMTDGLYGKLDGKHQEILEIVTKQASHLKNMIDQILIYSRLEANKQPLRVEEFSVHKVLGDLRETFDFLCKQKGLELQWQVARDVPDLKNDPERFKEIVSNLLQNALKYTDRGTVQLTLKHLPGVNSVMLQVRDTGIGIPENYLATIFDPFTQAHKTSTENSRGGIGLGLSIVKKHVEQLNGKIAVESKVGEGSTFTVVIPRAIKLKSSKRSRFLRFLERVPKMPLRLSSAEKSRAVEQSGRAAV